MSRDRDRGDTEVVVGRIGKRARRQGRGLGRARTDEPERRFADGAVLATGRRRAEPRARRPRR